MITSYKTPVQSDWLWHQTPHSFGTWGTIQMRANSEAPDILLLYNFHQFKSDRPQAIWQRWQQRQALSEQDITKQFRGVASSRIVSLTREPPFPEKLKRRASHYKQAEAYCGYVSGPDDLAPVPDYMPAIWYISNPFRDLDEASIPEKSRPCSWITSGIDRTANHRKRLAFLKQVQEHNLNVDLYGRDLPTWAQSNGSVANKWHCMAPYYYNLAIENYADNQWYVSEKLWDALLSWCLPIYYGGSAADKLLPPGSFLRVPSLDDEGLRYIQEVTATPDAWHDAKAAIAEARQIILHELNLLNWLSKFVAQLD